MRNEKLTKTSSTPTTLVYGHQTASKKNAFDALELGIDLDFVVEGSRFVSRGRKVIEIESVKSEEKKTPYTLTLCIGVSSNSTKMQPYAMLISGVVVVNRWVMGGKQKCHCTIRDLYCLFFHCKPNQKTGYFVYGVKKLRPDNTTDDDTKSELEISASWYGRMGTSIHH